MKRLIWLLIMVFALVGCSKSAEPVVATPVPEVSNPKGYMAAPEIRISSEHVYKQESWVGEELVLNDPSITMQGNSFFLTVIFQGNIAEDKLKEAVIVEGYEDKVDVTVTLSEGKTVFYGCYRNVEKNKSYKLTISKDIANSEGKTLQSDILKEITLKPDTTATYTLLSNSGNVEDLGWQNVADAFAVGNTNWSPDPKTILVDFSAEVDKASVEQSIKESFTGKDVRYSLQWNNPNKLTLKLENLKSGDPEPYAINMVFAKDANGNGVYGNLFFVTSAPNYLGSIDIKAKKDSAIYKFLDKRYMAVQNPRINNCIVLDDTGAKYIFDMASKQLRKIDINREYTIGIPGFTYVYTWLDRNHMALLNKTDGTILSYSTADGSSKELFVLPLEVVKSSVIEIAASPDGSKLAVTYETLPSGQTNKHDFILNVFDAAGKSIYVGTNQFMPRFQEMLGSVTNIKWMDEENLIMEDNVSNENSQDYNVIGINIKTGQKSVVAEHAFKPAILPGKNMLKVESFKNYYGDHSIDVIKAGKKIKSFKTNASGYGSFFFSDENTLVYNEGDKILAYYIDNGKTEQLGNGYIIGLSDNSSKLYYLTNHKMLYYLN